MEEMTVKLTERCERLRDRLIRTDPIICPERAVRTKMWRISPGLPSE